MDESTIGMGYYDNNSKSLYGWLLVNRDSFQGLGLYFSNDADDITVQRFIACEGEVVVRVGSQMSTINVEKCLFIRTAVAKNWCCLVAVEDYYVIGSTSMMDGYMLVISFSAAILDGYFEHYDIMIMPINIKMLTSKICCFFHASSWGWRTDPIFVEES